ncbi:hypothetical protein CNH00080 [Cryptococcus deneoformans JEC21]|uniref:Transmembrane protein n=1 Tax=Cryptococcus deneoformans (strain JEC21 / ATCC MYA-565) TaxID=214684 RepID=Q5KC80_CRYD1|nr:hypothetical protein CNH00080 [Cryptococcus neoformans var. neoformans JEC21]AAW44895.2 hypothetical protein CNH00080 [Cryptococcus neoformans var. neoformans JEC21]
MASVLLGEPNSLPSDSAPEKRRKIPKVAFYVAGSAFALTIGMTAMVIPFVRQAAKTMNGPQFMSHRNLEHLASRRFPSPSLSPFASSSIPPRQVRDSSPPVPPPSALKSAIPAYSSASISAEIPISEEDIKHLGEGSKSTLDPVVQAEESAETIKSRLFNAREEKALYGSSLMPLSSNTASEGEGEGGGDKMEGALLGAKALMFATTLVVGFTGLGMWAVGKAMGAEDPADFAVKMRQQLVLSMPQLVTSVNRPGRSTDGFDSEAIEKWVNELEREEVARPS